MSYLSPHFPHDHDSPWSAMKIPAPHLGQGISARGCSRCIRLVHDLVFFLLPDVVGTLSLAVRATLVNTILTFESVKPSTLAHKQTLNTLMHDKGIILPERPVSNLVSQKIIRRSRKRD